MQHSIRSLWFLLLFGITTTLLAQNPFTGPTVLEDVLEESNGVAFGDYDNDGWVDLYITRANSTDGDAYLNLLFRNVSGTLTKQTIAGVTDLDKTSGSATWGDYDNDGDLDLYVAEAQQGRNGTIHPNTFLLNNGSGSFSVNPAYGVIVSQVEDARMVGWGDYNNDGYIDVFVKRGFIHFFAGDQPEVSSFFANSSGTGSSIPGSIGAITTAGTDNIYKTIQSGLAWCDFNNDGYMDIYSPRGSDKRNALWKNNGTTFVDDTPDPPLRAILTSTQGGSWGDFDNDGDMDLFTATKPESDVKHSYLFTNESTPSTTAFTDVTASKGGPINTDDYYIRGSGWGDFDNDGDLDLLVNATSSQSPVHENPPSRLYENSGSPNYTFSLRTTLDLDDGDGTLGNGKGLAWSDIDNDGDLDFAISRFEEPYLYTNDGTTNKYASIQCVGLTKNVSAIGTQVIVQANIPEQTSSTSQIREISGQTGFASQNDLRAHFGLGTASKIDQIDIKWLNSSGGSARTTNTYTDMPVSKFMVFTEGTTTGTANVIKEQAFMYLIGNTGAAVEFETNTDTDGGTLTITRTNSDPGSAGFSGSATSDDATLVTPNVVSPARYWTIGTTGLTGFTAEVYIDITDVAGIGDADKLVILKRANSGAAWTPINTKRIGNTLYSDANNTSFSEFAIGGDSGDNSLPVELTSFTAVTGNQSIELKWETASELENLGYILEKSIQLDKSFVEIASYKDNVEMLGQGNSSVVNNYSFVDKDVINGQSYFYRLSDISIAGVRTYHSVIEASARQLITGFKLYPNYPNPFNPQTKLRFEIPTDKANTHVNLGIYNSAGKLVYELVSAELSSGVHEFTWNGTNKLGGKQASGVYFARFTASNFVQTHKMILLK